MFVTNRDTSSVQLENEFDEVWVCGCPLTMTNEDLRIEIPYNDSDQL